MPALAPSTPFSFSRQAVVVATAFLMTLPLWTHYSLGSEISTDGGQYIYVLPLLALIFPLFLLLQNTSLEKRVIRGLCEFLLILLIPLLISIAVNITYYSTTIILICAVRMTALILFVTLIVTIEMHEDAHRILQLLLLALSCILASLFIFASVATPMWQWGRFTPNGMQPNWWGEVLFLVVFGAAFTSSLVLRYGLWALALVGLVLVQSRGSLLAALLMIAVVTLAGLRSRTVIAIGVAGTIGIVLDVFVFETRFSSAAQDFVAEKVLLVNDSHRGLGTGLSGRYANVGFGFELFLEHPWAGVGFGRSDPLAFEAVGATIHNGYVTLLADLGAPLFAILAIIMFGALWLSFVRKDWKSLGMIVSFMFGFFMVAPRAINMSLPTMLFWAFVARSWILPLRSRHHR